MFADRSYEERDDKYIALAAISTNYDNIRYTSIRLRDDDDIVIAAMNGNPHAFRYASDRLRGNFDLARVAINFDYKMICDVSKEIKENKEFMIEMARIHLHMTGKEFTTSYPGVQLSYVEHYKYDDESPKPIQKDIDGLYNVNIYEDDDSYSYINTIITIQPDANIHFMTHNVIKIDKK